jgi:hypothetical protein
LNFNQADDCKDAMKYLNSHNQGMRIEFAKKKQLGSKKGKKNGEREIGKCFRCNVKGHTEEECYNIAGILPVEIWFQNPRLYEFTPIRKDFEDQQVLEQRRISILEDNCSANVHSKCLAFPKKD